MRRTGRVEDTTFGGLLRSLREGAGLSQEQLASRAGLSVNAVGTLERGVRRRPHPHTVRSLADAMGLQEVDRAALVEAARGETVAPHGQPAATFPTSTSGLVGREAEVGDIVGMLGRERLVTLTGPGGVGKTRLALAVAEGARETFPNGVALVPLAPLGDPALVMPAVAGELGIKVQGGIATLVALRLGLGTGRLLLVLDNFEHVMGAATDVAALLAVCPNLAVLATSREALRLAGEQRFPLPPLPVPGPAAAAEEAARTAAVRLFVRRAREANPGFSLDRENAAAVAAICRRLDGLPLALELAAARTTVLSPAALLARLDPALPLLTGGPRDLPERQQTMRRTIAWSYDLLDGPEKDVFRALAVFSGGFTLEAAEAVCGEVLGEDAAVFEVLSSLLDKSLVVAEPGSGPRFGMLETVRAYALERLTGDEEGVRRQHALFYLRLTEETEPRLNGPDRAGWLEKLEGEHDNLRDALSWSVGGEDPAVGLRLAGSLFWFWFHRGYWDEGRSWMEKALAGAGGLPTLARARALCGAGGIACSQGDYASAYPMLEEAVGVWRAMGGEPGISHGVLFFCVAVLGLGEPGRAEELALEAREDFRRLGDAFGEASLLAVLGLISLLRRDYAEARSRFEECIRIARKLGDDWLTMLPLRNLGIVALRQGDPAEAERRLKEGLDGLRRLEERWFIASTIEYLAEALAFGRDPAQAARLFGAAEAMRETVRSFAEPYAPADYDRSVAAAREELGEADFEVAWREGRAMSYDEAISYALEEQPQRDLTPPR